METIQADPLKCDKLLNILKKVWEEGKETDELVLSPGTIQAGTEGYKGFSTYINHLGDIDDINSEKKQKHNTTTITCDNNFKQHSEHYTNFNHLKDIAENNNGMILRVINILRQSFSGKNGAKQALFPWHIDSKTDRLDN